MTRGMDWYLERIRDDAYARFYAADHTAMMPYPFRLGRAGKDGSDGPQHESSPTIAKRSDHYILDSAIGDEDVGNQDVLDRAANLDYEPDILVAADKLQDPEVTTERVMEMLRLIDEHPDYHPEVIIPLQFDEETSHSEHYDSLADRLDAAGFDISDHILGVGGIKDEPVPVQVNACIEVREHVGLDPQIHAFGLGCSWDWMVTIQTCPWLIDSFDNSSVVQAVNNGRIFDSEFSRMGFKLPRGKNSTVLSAMMRELHLHLVNYLMGPHVRDSDRPESFRESEYREDLEAVVMEHHLQYAAKSEPEKPAAAIAED